MSQLSHDAHVSAQFSPQAQAYLTSAVHAEGQDLLEFAQIIRQHKPATALDLGCGGGHVAFLLAGLVQHVIAYDLSDAMLAIVRAEADRRGLGNLETVQGSVAHLPWGDAQFDLVVSRYSAHHWQDIRGALAEARRVLKPGGLGVFMDVVAPSAALQDTWLQSLELLRDPSHVRNYSASQWQGLLQEAGFRPAQPARFRLRLEFASWIQRMQTPDTHVQAIRSLVSRAGTEVTRYFEIEADGSFTLDSMLLVAD